MDTPEDTGTTPVEAGTEQPQPTLEPSPFPVLHPLFALGEPTNESCHVVEA